MFDSLHRIVGALAIAALALALGAAFWNFGFFWVLLALVVVGLLTYKKLWIACLLGLFFGLH
ncbi:MAG: hypothetical protein ACKVOT_13885 [Polaromonas sp.]